MKFGCYIGLNLALKRYTPKEAIRQIREMGYDYVEPLYSASLYTDRLLPYLKEAMEEQGVPMPCYSLCADLLGVDALDTVKKVADQASFLVCRYVHHTLLPSLAPPSTDADCFSGVVSRLKESCAYARQKGLTVLVEPQGMVFNGVPMLQRLFEAMEGEDFAYCSDVGNGLFVDADPMELANCFYDRTRHVHVKDYRYLSEGGAYRSLSHRRFEEVIPGEGDLPLREFLALYREKDVCVSVEYDGPWERQEEALRRVKALAEA